MSNKIYFVLLNQTHSDSGLSLRTVAERAGIDHTAASRILPGNRTTRRVTLLTPSGWDLDRASTNGILKTSGVKLLCEKER